MILYALHCQAEHRFESWFQSAAAFDGLLAARLLNCPVCGGTGVAKSLMAPMVHPGPQSKPSLQGPATEQEVALAALRARIEANSDYVGMNFVAQARAMHEGSVPERSIYGEARPEEAIKLLQEGIRVAPLPFMPSRKTN